MDLGPVGKALEDKLKIAFSPLVLSVIDESHQHAGHSGAHALGESHFRVKITAEAFKGQSRVNQHRMVNQALAEELRTRVHALALETSSP
jgi:BolA family transcriptional regulator, general stress-responsive regulator